MIRRSVVSVIAIVSIVGAFVPRVVQGFSISQVRVQRSKLPSHLSRPHRDYKLAAGKGFGNIPEPEPKKKKNVSFSEETKKSSVTLNAPSVESRKEVESGNAGQWALAEMRRQRAEQKDAELRKMREMIQADRQIQSTPAAIPEKVAQRMGARMLGFVGVPLFLGLGTFVGFWYFATYKNIEFQPGLVAATTISLLAISLLGITYSLMSSSWDEEREGDALGTEEFRKNVENIKDGLARSKENVILRDKLARADSSELAQVMSTLEPKESNKPETLEAKLQKELE